ncbi:MAG: transcription elongation factor GreA [Chloroflexi bacterium]|nr:transcription elongation factor GreA [Chloroflexota bacterium]
MERSGPVTLLQAVGSYVSSVKGNEDQGAAQRVLHRFVNWCGPDRTLTEIKPPEIGEYADQLGATGTAPEAADRLQIIKDFLSYARKNRLIDKNLAQHVRVRKSKSLSRRQGGPGGPEAIKLTRDGLTRLQAELDKLKAERAPLAMQIRKAAADKDVRENVPLEAAREQLGHAEARIRTIEGTLKYAVVIDSTGQAAVRVQLGSKVSVRDIGSGRKTTYTLVSAAEANPLEGKISDVSPLGKALLKRYAGDEVEFDTPRGKTRYRVVKITS